MKLWFT